MALKDDDGQESNAPVEIPAAGPLVVTPDAPDDGGSDEGEGGAEDQAASGERPVARQAGTGRQGRPENRKERGKLFLENQRLKEQLGSLSPKMEEMKRDFQAQIAAITAAGQRQAAPQQGQQGDPYTAAISEIDRDMAREMKLMRQWDEQRDGQFDPSRYNQLQARKFQVIAQQALAQERARTQYQQRTQQSQQGQADPQQQHRFNVLCDEFPWLSDDSNPMPRMAVGHEYRRLVASGRPDSLALHREAAATVAARFGMAGPRQQSRPNRGVPSDGMRGDGGQQNEEVQIPPEMLQGLGLPMHKIQEALFGKPRNGT